ncbi:MAG: hypothetical protein ACPGWR_05050 [Ardenticatenaceae bacterium]
MNLNSVDWQQLFLYFLGLAAVSLFLATIMGIWIWHSVSKFRLPDDVTFIEAMRLSPFRVVLFLDLLDFGLDFFSAPISWMLLSRLGLTKLRGATILEAFIPGTQAIPTMTLTWIFVRLFGPKLEDIPFLQDSINRGAEKRLNNMPKR